MPRLPRFHLIGVPQHVVQRGNNRQACFFDPDDYRFYLDRLQNAAAAAGVDVHAYVLMTNHVHLLVTPQRDSAVSKMMQSIGRSYVQYVNRRQQRTGTLWEGRYKASPVESERYLLTCYRYIELNPVRARNMANHPADYPWSSYHANAHGDGGHWLTPHPLYQRLGSTNQARQKAYCDLFAEAPSAETMREIRRSTQQGVVLGSERFRKEIEQATDVRATPRKRGRPKQRVSPQR
ncbi:transposase [Salinisphaera sp.]|uniref:transposase n=1 Tax=Salinisphaera sp. TaxID=1914330 RepID=UPI002D78E7C3|nr:transposase [Salinisphaera sp.]HET7313254.1 transposase [Salinisphaera sp.]